MLNWLVSTVIVGRWPVITGKTLVWYDPKRDEINVGSNLADFVDSVPIAWIFQRCQESFQEYKISDSLKELSQKKLLC